MRSSVCPALTTAAIVHGLSTDHDRRRGQRCTVLTHPVSLIHRGIFVQMNRATSFSAAKLLLNNRTKYQAANALVRHGLLNSSLQGSAFSDGGNVTHAHQCELMTYAFDFSHNPYPHMEHVRQITT
jgi:hypothetical protein